jgi:hypothetical protein
MECRIANLLQHPSRVITRNAAAGCINCGLEAEVRLLTRKVIELASAAISRQWR